jgi:hypothetical protein
LNISYFVKSFLVFFQFVVLATLFAAAMATELPAYSKPSYPTPAPAYPTRAPAYPTPAAAPAYPAPISTTAYPAPAPAYPAPAYPAPAPAYSKPVDEQPAYSKPAEEDHVRNRSFFNIQLRFNFQFNVFGIFTTAPDAIRLHIRS